MEIKEIKRIVNLIKKIECENYALIRDVAKEMGAKKTQLMQYIEDNPKLFKTKEIISKKSDKRALAIVCCYDDAAQNPETDEWLEVMKKKWEKKIHISGCYYYGYLEYYYVGTDRDSNRENLWRNTPEKIQELVDKGIIKKSERWVGGVGDATKHEAYIVAYSTLEPLLESIGWTSDFDEILEREK